MQVLEQATRGLPHTVGLRTAQLAVTIYTVKGRSSLQTDNHTKRVANTWTKTSAAFNPGG